MKLLIDWSVLCHTCWHIMRSPNYEARTDVEASEFARNLAGSMLYYKERFQPDEIIFALDSRKGYWRHDVMDEYYKKWGRAFKYKDTDTDKILYILKFDLKTYRIEWFEGSNKWISKKLTVDEKEKLIEEYGGENSALVQVPYHKIPGLIRQFFPAYKGHRKDSQWDYATTREEWYILCAKIVNNLAVTFGGKIVLVDQAEADDVAKVYADINASHEMIFLTTDSDWSQMLVDHMFLKLYNPTSRVWNETEPKEADYQLAKKLMCGDATDNIPGISLKGMTATMGPKAAEKLITDIGIKKVYEELETIANVPGLYRNYELIFLDNMPEDIEKKITVEIEAAKIPKSKKPFNYAHFGVTKKDELGFKGEAKKDRDVDLEDGKLEG